MTQKIVMLSEISQTKKEYILSYSIYIYKIPANVNKCILTQRSSLVAWIWGAGRSGREYLKDHSLVMDMFAILIVGMVS